MSNELTTAMIQSTEHWTRPDPRLVCEKYRDLYVRRCAALSAVLQGASIRQASTLHNLNRDTLGATVHKAFLSQPDGKLVGYRACVPHRVRITTKAPPERAPVSGHAHALGQLFAVHPDIKEMLDGYHGALPPGRLPPAFKRLLSSIRGLLVKRESQSLWPMNTPDRGRRVFARYIKRMRQQAIVDGAPSVPSTEAHTIKRLDQLFLLHPFDRVEFDAHRMDVDWRLLMPNARGELIITSISAIWILAIIDVASTAILGWKLVTGRSYSALDVSQCFATAMRRWEPRSLVVPDMQYVPGAMMPSAIDLSVPIPMGRLTAMDNAKAHKAKLPLEAWLRAHHGVLNFGRPHLPEARPHIEQFFHRIEVGALRQIPGGFAPRRVNQPAIATSAWSSSDHPVDFQALEDLMDVVITGHNVSPIPARQNRTPVEIISAYRNTAGYWMSPPYNDNNVKALTTTCHKVKVKGSKAKGKPVRVQFLQVDYRHPDLDKAWELVGKEFRAIVDYEDLRTISLVDDSLRVVRVLTAADPWRRQRHDISMRRRILALSRSGELEIRGVESAVAAFAAYTFAQAGRSVVAADQAARLMQLAHGDEGNPCSTLMKDANHVDHRSTKQPISGAVSFNEVEEFR